MADKKQKKIKKRKWIELIAPDVFRQMPIGSTYVQELENVTGKRMTVNLMALTSNPRNQSINVHLEVTKIKDNKGFTELTGYEVSRSSIRRLVRRGKTKLESTMHCKTADNKRVILKLFLICINEITTSVATAIRKSAEKFLVLEVSKLKYDDLVTSLLSNELAKKLRSKITKVYPLKTCQIRSMSLLTGEKAAKAKEIKIELEAPKSQNPEESEGLETKSQSEESEEESEEKPKEKKKALEEEVPEEILEEEQEEEIQEETSEEEQQE